VTNPIVEKIKDYCETQCQSSYCEHCEINSFRYFVDGSVKSLRPIEATSNKPKKSKTKKQTILNIDSGEEQILVLNIDKVEPIVKGVRIKVKKE